MKKTDNMVLAYLISRRDAAQKEADMLSLLIEEQSKQLDHQTKQSNENKFLKVITNNTLKNNA